MNQPGKRTSIVRRLVVQRLPVAVYASRVIVKTANAYMAMHEPKFIEHGHIPVHEQGHLPKFG